MGTRTTLLSLNIFHTFSYVSIPDYEYVFVYKEDTTITKLMIFINSPETINGGVL